MFTFLLSTEMLLAAASNTELHQWSENSLPGARPTWRRYYNEWSRPQAQHLQRVVSWDPTSQFPTETWWQVGKHITTTSTHLGPGSHNKQLTPQVPLFTIKFIPTHSTMISLYPTYPTMISLYPNSPHHDLSLSQL